MNDSQENKLSMYFKVQTFLDINADTIAVNAPILIGEKEKFITLIAELEAHHNEASQVNTGYTIQKQIYREKFRQKVLELSGALRSLLLLDGKHFQAEKAYISKSVFDKKRDGELSYVHDVLKDLATEHAAGLADFGFDNARLTQITVTYNLFKSFIAQPGDERSQSASANDLAVQHYIFIDNQLEIIDGIMQTVSEIHQGLYLQYKYDRLIDDTGDNTPTPPDYTFTLNASELKLVAELPYNSFRSFKAKNLGNSDVLWSLSTLNNAYSTTAQPLLAKSTSNKNSSTLANDGNFLLFQNLSTESVDIEVTVFE